MKRFLILLILCVISLGSYSQTSYTESITYSQIYSQTYPSNNTDYSMFLDAGYIHGFNKIKNNYKNSSIIENGIYIGTGVHGGDEYDNFHGFFGIYMDITNFEVNHQIKYSDGKARYLRLPLKFLYKFDNGYSPKDCVFYVAGGPSFVFGSISGEDYNDGCTFIDLPLNCEAGLLLGQHFSLYTSFDLGLIKNSYNITEHISYNNELEDKLKFNRNYLSIGLKLF